MKKITLVLLILISSLSIYASTCANDLQYKKNGWVVTYPEDFDTYVKHFNLDLNDGLANGYFIPDLEGIIATRHSKIQSRLYMNVRTWDDTETSTLEMFGDIAMFRNNSNLDQVLEIRWYNEGVRHVFVNKKYLDCVSTSAPIAVNAIL